MQILIPIGAMGASSEIGEFLAVRYMSSSVRLLSVTFVGRSILLRRLKFSAMFLRHLVPWPSVDIQVKF